MDNRFYLDPLEGEKKYENEELDYRIGISNNAKEMISKKKHTIIKNMGDSINSPYNDYVPVITSDEAMMLFTSRRDGSTGNKET